MWGKETPPVGLKDYYEPVQKLGTGGFGDIILAKHGNIKVAIKIMEIKRMEIKRESGKIVADEVRYNNIHYLYKCIE